jgi:hypothetical protein
MLIGSSHFGCYTSGTIIRCKNCCSIGIHLIFPKDSVVWFYLVTFKHIFLIKKKIYTQITHALFLAFNSIFYIFFKFSMLSELHSLHLKLCTKQYNQKNVLHLFVAPQLSSSWQHNYSTKTRYAGQANEQSMSMPALQKNQWSFWPQIQSKCTHRPMLLYFFVL